jgi:UDP-glucuronate 4-epimerase
VQILKIRSVVARYLVTGAAGFIASRVCELLTQRGDQVVGVDNLNDAYDVRLKEWRLKRLKSLTGFEFIQADITGKSVMGDLFSKHGAGNRGAFDAVVNLAARAGVRQSVANPWVYYETNVTGTLNLLELCREYGCKKLLLASTSSLYGSHNPRPFREDADTNRVLSPYAASKKGAETLCYTYHYLYHIDIAIPRYFTVFGPAGRPDMSLFRFVQWISEGRTVTVFGDGHQSRDFTFVDDIARGTIAGLELSGYNIFNLGSDRPTVLMDAIRMIEQKTGKRARLEFRPLHPADVLATWADLSKTRGLIEWSPSTGLDEGIDALIQWYKVNRDWAKDVRTD